MIKAVSDRVILIPEPVKDQINGIYIPDTSLKKPQRGHVVSVGPDCREVKIGYEVTFLCGHGVLIEDEGIEKLIITEKDVLGYSCNIFPQKEAYFDLSNSDHIDLHFEENGNIESYSLTALAIKNSINKMFNFSGATVRHKQSK